MKKKTKGKKRVMTLKLDMSKAYNRIKRGFVTTTLEVMGFLDGMVKLIKRCIKTVSYRILINGKPGKEFFFSGKGASSRRSR